MPKLNALIDFALFLAASTALAQMPPSKVLAPPKAGTGALYESLDAAKTGVSFANRIVPEHPMNRLYASSMCVGGVAVGDVDNDGLLDLFFTSGPEKNRLYRAKAPFVWEDATTGPLDGGDAWGAGCSMVDVDGDGDLDIYVCNYESPNQLFINALVPSGKLAFAEKAAEFGIATVDAGHTPAFCDYDRDGDLDLYLMANLLYLEEGSRPANPNAIVEMENGIPVISEKYRRFLKISGIRQKPSGGVSVDWDKRGRPHFLFRNEGGAFTNVTEEAGINTDGGMGLGAIWWDYNQDGWPDLYVACDFDDPDRCYRNNGDGTFTDIVKTAVPNTPWFSMGADFGDLNGDGRPDFIATDMLGSTHFKRKTSTDMIAGKSEFLAKANPRQAMRNVVYLNTATERFIECAQFAGLDRTDWTWAVRIADYDNDGRNDVFFTNGMSRNYNDSDNPAVFAFRPGETEWQRHSRAGTPPLKERNFAFVNRGDMRFEEVGAAWGLDHVGMSFAAATADFDKDGNLDLVLVNLDEPVFIYRNTGNENHRALVKLVSRMGDRRGIGAQVSASTDESYITSEVTLTRGYMACNEPLVHLGLGRATKIRRLSVRWPSGHVQWFDDLDADRFYTITEPGGAAPGPPFSHRGKFPHDSHRIRPVRRCGTRRFPSTSSPASPCCQRSSASPAQASRWPMWMATAAMTFISVALRGRRVSFFARSAAGSLPRCRRRLSMTTSAARTWARSSSTPMATATWISTS
jgi:enediyne biosynthesis protein E4